MPEMQQLADTMLAAAATVLGRLADQPADASAASRHVRDGSIRTDGDELVTRAEIPSLGIGVVVRYAVADMERVVGLMLGGAEGAGDVGAVQLSIVSETVSQITAAMAERLATAVGAPTEGIRAECCSDAALLPAPPFESYEGMIQVGSAAAPSVTIDFDGVARSKLFAGGPTAPSAAPPSQPSRPEPSRRSQPQPAPAAAQPVSFAAMSSVPMRSVQPSPANLDLVHDVPLQISAVLGKTALTLRDVVSLQAGSVFELDKLSTDPIDLYVNNILIARGEVVVVDDKYAVKISELNPSVAK